MSHRLWILLVAATVTYQAWPFAPSLRAEAPEISDPEGRWPEGTVPGPYPTSVTSANVDVIPLPGGELNGTNSDTLRVTFPSAGPLAWTESRHNEGDIALLISPTDPNDASYYPEPEFIENYSPFQSGDGENSTLAWRVSRATGALFASVRGNGVDQQINVNGELLGIMHGVAYFNSGFGQGWGYRMEDGVFANGGGASSDLQMGVAGNDDGAGEASLSVAATYFPYEQGWLGAWVAPPVDEIAEFSFASPGLDSSVASWIPLDEDVLDGALGRIELPDVNSATDGMLFVAPSNSDNATNIAAAAPREGGWDVAVREDNDDDVSGQTFAVANELDYQFLYVPYDSVNLVGGHVQGTDGTLLQSAGDSQFSLTRRGDGEYAVSILDGEGAKRTEDNGVLLLSVAGFVDGPGSLPDRAFMSYEYDSQSGDFIVQSRQLTEIGDPQNSQNVFGDVLALSDTDFYFAYIDFTNPLRPPGDLAGDFDGDGLLTAADIDDLTRQVADGQGTAPYDLNNDSVVDAGDINVWVKDLFKSWIGDANLDNEFNSTDLVAVLSSGTYEADVDAVWSTGDFNGDGRANSGDLVVALTDGGYELGPPPAVVASVPEPTGAALLLLGILALGRPSRALKRSH